MNNKTIVEGLTTLTIADIFYPGYLLFAFILTLIFIPRKEYKNYFIYGILLGGLGDFVIVLIFQNLLGIIWFKNQGMFNVLDQIALSPPSWTLTVMLFLYFLPARRLFLYPYVATWAVTSVGFGYVVRNAGLFDVQPWFYPIPGYLTFLSWWVAVTWIYTKTRGLLEK